MAAESQPHAALSSAYLRPRVARSLYVNRLAHTGALNKLVDLIGGQAPQGSHQSGDAAAPWTLEGLLKGCEHKGYRSAEQPDGLLLTLKPYQLQSRRWLPRVDVCQAKG